MVPRRIGLFSIVKTSCSGGGAMVARTTCNPRVASSSLTCVTFVSFFWQYRLVHKSMNTASRGLSVHSKRPHFSGGVSAGNALRKRDALSASQY